MSKPKVFEKPSGVRDYLPEAASKLRAIEWNVLQCMDRWGYRQIITPTLEYYDTVGAASSTANEKLFKLLDNKGTTLVLRSEMTAPIARVVSSLLKDEALPLRLSHHSNVFRAIEEEAGREAEFVQTGVELVGDGSAEADAEVIALAIACLQAAGVRDFKIALGHIGFLNGVLQSNLPDRPAEQQQLKQFLLQRDYVGYRHYLQGLPAPAEAKQALARILRLRGGQETCREAEQLAQDASTSAALRHLSEVWDALNVYGAAPHALIDLTMIGNFSYYTGLIFEGYAADLGFPVCSGGRYDNLLERFGRPAPATGFALETNRIMQVAEERRARGPHRVLVLYTKEHREAAVAAALDLRSKQGYAVETRYVAEAPGAAAIQVNPDGDGATDTRSDAGAYGRLAAGEGGNGASAYTHPAAGTSEHNAGAYRYAAARVSEDNAGAYGRPAASAGGNETGAYVHPAAGTSENAGAYRYPAARVSEDNASAYGRPEASADGDETGAYTSPASGMNEHNAGAYRYPAARVSEDSASAYGSPAARVSEDSANAYGSPAAGASGDDAGAYAHPAVEVREDDAGAYGRAEGDGVAQAAARAKYAYAGRLYDDIIVFDR